jgi:hypothetical protein
VELFLTFEAPRSLNLQSIEAIQMIKVCHLQTVSGSIGRVQK